MELLARVTPLINAMITGQDLSSVHYTAHLLSPKEEVSADYKDKKEGLYWFMWENHRNVWEKYLIRQSI